MTTLARNIRKDLEKTVTKARRVAEAGSRKVLEQLAVHHHEPWGGMTPEQRFLRNRLRAHGRQLGDQRDSVRGIQTINHLMTECAYEQWHRMLFARFLAEADLLIEPESGMPLTLDECQELAREQGTDWLELASTYAERMLPQIFRSGDPVLEVGLPPETRSELEDLLKVLPTEVFLADDSLGWVYQFWQTARKKEVNDSGVKIGADELPAVTQLFTEDYMVYFLLHNTLGAWWAGKVLAQNHELARTATSEIELRVACAVGGIDWDYLRFVQDDDGVWRPAAGIFDGWPKLAKEIKLLDPSMGSGHFLVFALPTLVEFRMYEEGLSREAAVDAVLRDNIYGLEIDPRCTQIAAFNLAFAAWRMVGFRALPPLHLACSGLSLGVSKSEWLKLAEQVSANLPVSPDRDLFGSKDNLFSARVKAGLESLYDLFAKAPNLGSLIDPRQAGGDLYEAGFHELEPLLAPLLISHNGDEIEEMAVAAQGMTKATEILAEQFELVITNVPYLGREGHSDDLVNYAQSFAPYASADLSTLMLQRCLSVAREKGIVAVVLPQNWWVGKAYEPFRKRNLAKTTWKFAAVLGEEAWQTFGNRGPNTVLLIQSKTLPFDENLFLAADVSTKPGNPVVTIEKKVAALAGLSNGDEKDLCELYSISQKSLLNAKQSRISIAKASSFSPLSKYVSSGEGCSTGDGDKFLRQFWELLSFKDWIPYCGPGFPHWDYCDCATAMYWQGGEGELAESPQARIQNTELWKRKGILVGRVRGITASIFPTGSFSKGAVLICPNDESNFLPVYAFLNSKEYEELVRTIDPRVSAATSVLTDVPFDQEHWKSQAKSLFPNGIPKPYSNAPPQWLFAGHPKDSDNPLQVAVARLLCYRWPRQNGFSFPECPIVGNDSLETHPDDDGIVCLNPLKGEPPADERLNALLADAYGEEWSAAKQATLLTEVGYAGKSLDDWLRDGFFAQHCELFQHRPFIWHIWDGRRDGFHALVNYHLLAAPNGEGRRTLDKLIYTYLGDWIDGQRRDQAAGVEGADARLVAAEHLKTELERIRNGESPYDIFIRWKPLHQQPIGWEPDINDGVRLNIRPFMVAKPYGSKAANACILRTTPKNIKWDKDRGKEPERKKEDFPWFWGWDGQMENFAGGKEFDGNRWNNLHYTNEQKRTAREWQGS
ncbi:MAG: SAM-dependent methyltransferase [Geobacter sp.]|nr:SAM-dependent methyltransferase [Geobacter sp.]